MIGEFILSIFYLFIGIGSVIGLVCIIWRSVLFIETRPHAAKKNITTLIHSIAILHIVPLIRGYSLKLLIYSELIILIFYQLIYNYPDVQLDSPYFIIGTILTLVNHFLYLRVLADNSHHPLEVIFYFIIFVWVVPFCFYLSLSANDMLIHEGGKRRETYLGKFFKELVGKIHRGLKNEF